MRYANPERRLNYMSLTHPHLPDGHQKGPIGRFNFQPQPTFWEKQSNGHGMTVLTTNFCKAYRIVRFSLLLQAGNETFFWDLNREIFFSNKTKFRALHKIRAHQF